MSKFYIYNFPDLLTFTQIYDPGHWGLEFMPV